MPSLVLSQLSKTFKTSFAIAKATFDAVGLTAARTFTLPDSAGTIALVDQLRGLIGVQVFTASGTWTKPAGTVEIVVEVQDGGGGGSGAVAAASQVECGRGGGGGGYRRQFITSGIGATETVTVGAGGTAGAAAGGAGGDGGASGFGTTLMPVANGAGGIGGVVSIASGTTSTAAAGGTPGATPAGGDVNIPGGGGPGPAIRMSGTSGFSGSAGSSIFGQGPRGVPDGVAGIAAPPFGAGGGAGCSNSATGRAGAAGSSGIVIVHAYGASAAGAGSGGLTASQGLPGPPGLDGEGDDFALAPYTAPFVPVSAAGACTGDQTLTTTATDITGATVTVGLPGTYVIYSVFDFDITTASVETAVGSCLVGGVAQGAEALLRCNTSLMRASVAQHYLVVITTSNTIIKLRVAKSGTGGVIGAKATHTRVVAVRVAS